MNSTRLRTIVLAVVAATVIGGTVFALAGTNPPAVNSDPLGVVNGPYPPPKDSASAAQMAAEQASAALNAHLDPAFTLSIGSDATNSRLVVVVAKGAPQTFRDAITSTRSDALVVESPFDQATLDAARQRVAVRFAQPDIKVPSFMTSVSPADGKLEVTAPLNDDERVALEQEFGPDFRFVQATAERVTRL